MRRDHAPHTTLKMGWVVVVTGTLKYGNMILPIRMYHTTVLMNSPNLVITSCHNKVTTIIYHDDRKINTSHSDIDLFI